LRQGAARFPGRLQGGNIFMVEMSKKAWIIADMAITTEAPRRNRRTDEEIARTGSRMLTGFVRLWGTSRIVTGVRSRLKNNLSRVKPEPLSA